MRPPNHPCQRPALTPNQPDAVSWWFDSLSDPSSSASSHRTLLPMPFGAGPTDLLAKTMCSGGRPPPGDVRAKMTRKGGRLATTSSPPRGPTVRVHSAFRTKTSRPPLRVIARRLGRWPSKTAVPYPKTPRLARGLSGPLIQQPKKAVKQSVLWSVAGLAKLLSNKAQRRHAPSAQGERVPSPGFTKRPCARTRAVAKRVSYYSMMYNTARRLSCQAKNRQTTQKKQRLPNPYIGTRFGGA